MITSKGLSLLLAEQQPMVPDQTGATIKFIGTMAIFMVVLWFLMIAPQRKKTKELEATIKSLKTGDRIVTASGIVGIVLSVKDKTMSIRSADTKIEILKTAVAEVTERGGDTGESKS